MSAISANVYDVLSVFESAGQPYSNSAGWGWVIRPALARPRITSLKKTVSILAVLVEIPLYR